MIIGNENGNHCCGAFFSGSLSTCGQLTRKPNQFGHGEGLAQYDDIFAEIMLRRFLQYP